MTHEDPSQTMRALMSECVDAVLSELGCPPLGPSEDTGEAPTGRMLAGVIGFSHEHLRGSLCLRMDDTVVRKTHPKEEEPQIRELLDWSAEISNLTLGRFKNRMIELGVRLQMGTPTAVTAMSGLRIAGSGTSETSQVVRTELGDVWVMIDLEVSDGLDLSEPAEAANVTPPGEMLLF